MGSKGINMSIFLSFHNKPQLKEALLTLLRNYQESDLIGVGGWSDDINSNCIGSGLECVAAKTATSPFNFDYFESEYGIPCLLAHLEAVLFYLLEEEEDRQHWSFSFVEAIPIGKDLSGVMASFIAHILTKKHLGVIALCPIDILPLFNRTIDLLNNYEKFTFRDFVLRWTELPKWSSLESRDVSLTDSSHYIFMRLYNALLSFNWSSKDAYPIDSILSTCTEVFCHEAKVAAMQRVCFDRGLFEREGIGGINRECEKATPYAEEEARRVFPSLYAFDLLDTLKNY